MRPLRGLCGTTRPPITGSWRGTPWRNLGGPCRSTPTRQACSERRRNVGTMNREWIKIWWKCHRRKSRAPWGNWELAGLRRIHRRPRGRVERNSLTPQDRLVKGLRVAGAKTPDQANQSREDSYLVWRERAWWERAWWERVWWERVWWERAWWERAWWGRELMVTPARPDNAHRPLKAGHNLAGAWSHVETRQVRNEDTLRFDKVLYRVKRESIVIGLRGAGPRFEWRSGWTARCIAVEVKPVPFVRNPAASRSNWNGKFDWKKAPPIGKAAQSSGHRTG